LTNPIFTFYGVMLLLCTGFAEYRGWSLSSINQVKNIPKTVRDNPGAYRSHYGGFSRYIGGK